MLPFSFIFNLTSDNLDKIFSLLFSQIRKYMFTSDTITFIKEYIFLDLII